MNKKFKIGIYGSAFTEDGKLVEKAKELGEIFDKEKTILITGGCSGLPYAVANQASKNGVEVWGYSPVRDLDEQKIEYPDDDSSIYSKLIFVPKNYEYAGNLPVTRKYRNVTSTANCDAGIIIAGRWGALNEFTNLFDMGKVVGVLTGTGGIADEIEHLSKKIYKKSNAVVLFNDNPKELVQKILNELSG